MFFLVHYARAVQALRRFLSRTGVLAHLDRRRKSSVWAQWLRSVLSVLDFHDFIILETPWWTLRAGREVKGFLDATPHARALEWGSGASTVWLGSLCESVVSIESDPAWADMVKGSVGDHVGILTPAIPRRTHPSAVRSRRWGFQHLDFTDYVNAVDQVEGKFHLIVIDGRAREACFERALPRLAPGGMILFDNTNRRRYRRALRSHRDKIVLTRHVGLTPIVLWPTETSVIRLAAHSR
jgi:hypothetical protein